MRNERGTWEESRLEIISSYRKIKYDEAEAKRLAQDKNALLSVNQILVLNYISHRNSLVALAKALYPEF